jgi:copper transport protein
MQPSATRTEDPSLSLLHRRTHSIRPLRLVVIVLALAGWTVPLDGAPPGVDARHTELSGADPAAGSEVSGAVAELRLRFTTAVQLPLSRVTVEDGTGVQRTGGLDLVEDSGGRELRLVLGEPLPPGVHRVVWQTAGPDGHVIRGEYLFTVLGSQTATAGDTPAPDTLPRDTAEVGAVQSPAGLPGDTGTAAGPSTPTPGTSVAAESSSGGGAAGLTFRWLQYLGTVLLLGGVGFRLGVVPGLLKESTLAPAAAAIVSRLATLTLAGAVVLAMSMPGRLWAQATSTWGAEVAVADLAALLFQTPWGWGWMIQGAAVLLAVIGVRLAAPGGARAGGWGLAAVGAAAAAFVPAFSGHAWGIEPRALGVVLSAGHVLGAGVWMGGLGCLLLAGIPGMKVVKGEGGTLPGLSALVNGFSRIALPAVLLLVVTGVGQNFFHLGNPGNLLVTGWGRALLVKFGLLAGAMALGLYNWRVVRPALQESPRAGLLRIPATLEFLLGLAVLVATGLLVVQSLPGSGSP